MKSKTYLIDNKELMSEWDYEKNIDLDPKILTPGSNKKAWWVCKKCGYKWLAVVGNRAKNHTGCPACANKVVVVGKNDLATVFPEIAKEWHPTKNNGLTPQMFTHGLKKLIWWKCSKCGHEYQATINHRTCHKSGCPLCASSSHAVCGINDLATEHPETANEWDYEKNGNKTPNELKSGSPKKVWWKCNKCGYEWQATIIKRVNGLADCPKCSTKYVKTAYYGVNDLATTHPEVAAEWHPTKNGDLTPKDVKSGSKRNVWWLCKKCGYEWERSVRNQVVTKTGCPFCCGRALVPGVTDLATTFSEVAAEWHPTKNGNLTPKDVMAGTHQKVWWKCKKGHEWQAMIYSRTKEHQGCPKCSTAKQTSFPEQAILYYIKMFFTDAINRYKSDFLGKQELDIYVPSIKCAIEYDGEVWHRQEKYEMEKRKYDICKKHGIELIRIREGTAKIKQGIADKQLHIRNPHDRMELDAVIKELMMYLNNHNLFGHIASVNTEKDRANILKMYKTSVEKNSLSTLYPQLVAEWDYDKNYPLLPEYFSTGTREQVWWKCSKCGNSWQSSILHRTKSNSGCPVCANKVVVSGLNDLATTHPDLAKDWNVEKNGELTVDKITFGSGKHVWWKCHKCGYEWKTPVNRRSSMNTGCPSCLGRRLIIGQTDLLTKKPEIAKIWHPTKNGSLTPKDIHAGTKTSVWWKCDRCGYEWKRSVKTQVKIRKCPHCAKTF